MMETWGGPAGDRGPGGERPLVGKGVEGERSCSLGLVLGEEEEESEEEKIPDGFAYRKKKC